MDITVHQKDAVNLIIECEKSIAKELSQYFTFYVPNYQYTPAYKKKVWDGQIRLFNLFSRTIYVGLLDYINKFAKDRKYTIEVDSDNLQSLEKNKISLDDFNDYVTNLNLKLKPHPHQLTATYHSINKNRCLLLSPTGSGKSLIIYMLMRYYFNKILSDEKILIVVPTIGLVNQMISDFQQYTNDNWSVDENIHAIFSGQDKKTSKKIVVSTWQSLYNMPNEYFDKFSVVFGDECHLFKSKSLVALMTKIKNAHYRIGTTGTLDGTKTHKLVIEGLFGKVFNVTSTKKLIDKNLLSDLKINCIKLTYNQDICNENKRLPYQEEIKYIVTNESRNKFIKKLSLSTKGNTLILFNFVEIQGKVLYELLKNNEENKNVFFIHGGTEAAQREEIRQVVNTEENAILVASYGTCSTGLNIPNIDNVVFASPSKSVIRVLQSIGRGLRKSKNQKITKIYDIADDMSYKSYVNHTLKHLDERVKIYTNEGFDFSITRIEL
tara:strand:- start:2193 stop:3671 length:1479 start_codon:yes stop_codon:yes gene_type:complete